MNVYPHKRGKRTNLLAIRISSTASIGIISVVLLSFLIYGCTTSALAPSDKNREIPGSRPLQIASKSAQKLIKSLELVKSSSDANGVVFDAPDKRTRFVFGSETDGSTKLELSVPDGNTVNIGSVALHAMANFATGAKARNADPNSLREILRFQTSNNAYRLLRSSDGSRKFFSETAIMEINIKAGRVSAKIRNIGDKSIAWGQDFGTQDVR